MGHIGLYDTLFNIAIILVRRRLADDSQVAEYESNYNTVVAVLTVLSEVI